MTDATATTATATAAPIPEQILIACQIATGEATDPSATAISVRAARRDLNAKGNGPEWYRLVWRGGAWQYFSEERMPREKFRSHERRVTLHGDAYAGEILAQHNLGGPIDAIYLVSDEYTGSDGDPKKVTSLEWTKQRDGIRVILPTGAHVTLPNPRKATR